MNTSLDDQALNQLFNDARTYSHWQGRPIAEAVLQKLYALTRMGPTSANCSPARFVFVMTPAGKERLKTTLAPGNVDQTMSAPLTVIVGSDQEFHEKLPQLYPHTDARAWFAGNDELIRSTAFRNSSLQGAYLILAARALGLDCGPMSGFDNDKVDAEFFQGTSIRSNFLINVGYGNSSKLHDRSPRLSFEEACQIV
jgi:3-hydroxypropanoate dehydrogenase